MRVWGRGAGKRDCDLTYSVRRALRGPAGDRQLLARAIINLLSNAIKFSAPGTGIELFCEHAGANAVVSVVDHGPGVEPERRAGALFAIPLVACIVDPIREGRGLGLAFVRVCGGRKHGGTALGRARARTWNGVSTLIGRSSAATSHRRALGVAKRGI